MIKWIVICLIALIVLGNLGIDVRKAIDSNVAQSNLEYAKNIVVFVWDKYLQQPIKFLWSEVFVKYVWTPVRNYLDKKFGGGDEEKETTMINSLNAQLAFFDVSRGDSI